MGCHIAITIIIVTSHQIDSTSNPSSIKIDRSSLYVNGHKYVPVGGSSFQCLCFPVDKIQEPGQPTGVYIYSTTHLPPLVYLCNTCSLVNKISAFQSVVYTYNFHILAIIETWLSDCIFDNELLPSGYSILCKDRSHRGGSSLGY